MSNRGRDGNDGNDRRNHQRLPMTIPVSLEVGEGAEPLTVENKDISWGGVRFVVPKNAIPNADSVTVKFPWSKGDRFTASAEVVRTEELDDEHALVAARFSSLSTSDQRRLEKLLTMLQGTTEGSAGHQAPLVPILEVLFSDLDEIRSKLAELAEGRLSVTVFESYEVNQSIRMILGGLSADQPALRLRARVVQIETLTSETESAWPMFNLQVRFEHPLHELKAAASSLSVRLPKVAPPARDGASEGYLTFDDEG